MPMTVAMITASMMLSTFRAMSADMKTMITIRILFRISISFTVAVGQRCRWTRSRERHDAPEVANVSVQDMDAAAKPMVRRPKSHPGTLSLMIRR